MNASQPKGEVEPIYESEVWFLEVDGLAIAYRLVLVYKGTASFVKTSYNAQFKKFSPGKFLMNVAIRETFKKKINVKKIDFITNLLVVQIWNPLCEHRTTVNIERNHLLSATLSFAYKNPIIRKFYSLTKKLFYHKNELKTSKR